MDAAATAAASSIEPRHVALIAKNFSQRAQDALTPDEIAALKSLRKALAPDAWREFEAVGRAAEKARRRRERADAARDADVGADAGRSSVDADDVGEGGRTTPAPLVPGGEGGDSTERVYSGTLRCLVCAPELAGLAGLPRDTWCAAVASLTATALQLKVDASEVLVHPLAGYQLVPGGGAPVSDGAAVVPSPFLFRLVRSTTSASSPWTAAPAVVCAAPSPGALSAWLDALRPLCAQPRTAAGATGVSASAPPSPLPRAPSLSLFDLAAMDLPPPSTVAAAAGPVTNGSGGGRANAAAAASVVPPPRPRSASSGGGRGGIALPWGAAPLPPPRSAPEPGPGAVGAPQHFLQGAARSDGVQAELRGVSAGEAANLVAAAPPRPRSAHSGRGSQRRAPSASSVGGRSGSGASPAPPKPAPLSLPDGMAPVAGMRALAAVLSRQRGGVGDDGGRGQAAPGGDAAADPWAGGGDSESEGSAEIGPPPPHLPWGPATAAADAIGAAGSASAARRRRVVVTAQNWGGGPSPASHSGAPPPFPRGGPTRAAAAASSHDVAARVQPPAPPPPRPAPTAQAHPRSRADEFHRSLGIPAPSPSRRPFAYHSGYERAGWAQGALRGAAVPQEPAVPAYVAAAGRGRRGAAVGLAPAPPLPQAPRGRPSVGTRQPDSRGRAAPEMPHAAIPRGNDGATGGRDSDSDGRRHGAPPPAVVAVPRYALLEPQVTGGGRGAVPRSTAKRHRDAQARAGTPAQLPAVVAGGSSRGSLGAAQGGPLAASDGSHEGDALPPRRLTFGEAASRARASSLSSAGSSAAARNDTFLPDANRDANAAAGARAGGRGASAATFDGGHGTAAAWRARVAAPAAVPLAAPSSSWGATAPQHQHVGGDTARAPAPASPPSRRLAGGASAAGYRVLSPGVRRSVMWPGQVWSVVEASVALTTGASGGGSHAQWAAVAAGGQNRAATGGAYLRTRAGAAPLHAMATAAPRSPQRYDSSAGDDDDDDGDDDVVAAVMRSPAAVSRGLSELSAVARAIAAGVDVGGATRAAAPEPLGPGDVFRTGGTVAALRASSGTAPAVVAAQPARSADIVAPATAPLAAATSASSNLEARLAALEAELAFERQEHARTRQRAAAGKPGVAMPPRDVSSSSTAAVAMVGPTLVDAASSGRNGDDFNPFNDFDDAPAAGGAVGGTPAAAAAAPPTTTAARAPPARYMGSPAAPSPANSAPRPAFNPAEAARLYARSLERRATRHGSGSADRSRNDDGGGGRAAPKHTTFSPHPSAPLLPPRALAVAPPGEARPAGDARALPSLPARLVACLLSPQAPRSGAPLLLTAAAHPLAPFLAESCGGTRVGGVESGGSDAFAAAAGAPDAQWACPVAAVLGAEAPPAAVARAAAAPYVAGGGGGGRDACIVIVGGKAATRAATLLGAAAASAAVSGVSLTSAPAGDGGGGGIMSAVAQLLLPMLDGGARAPATDSLSSAVTLAAFAVGAEPSGGAGRNDGGGDGGRVVIRDLLHVSAHASGAGAAGTWMPPPLPASAVVVDDDDGRVYVDGTVACACRDADDVRRLAASLAARLLAWVPLGHHVVVFVEAAAPSGAVARRVAIVLLGDGGAGVGGVALAATLSARRDGALERGPRGHPLHPLPALVADVLGPTAARPTVVALL